MDSRLPTYVHPVCGRALGWHALRAMSLLDPPPERLFLPATEPLADALVSGLPAELLELEHGREWWPQVDARLGPEVERLLIVDAAAATLAGSLEELVAGPTGVLLEDREGQPLAVWLDRAALAEHGPADEALASLDACCDRRVRAADDEAVIVTGREPLARAGRIIRDRIVRRLMDGGVTFLLPESVLVDVDVSIERDTIIYPGVVLEGETQIGTESVIGPGCRIIDSRIGNGVELKGWNYIVRANIRNRAVLEPYVRRGFD